MIVLLLIVLILFGIVLNEISDFDLLSKFISTFSIFALVISLLYIVCERATIDAYVEANRELYKTLVYKVESNAYRDEFGYLNKEIIDEVQEWNTDVKFYQSIQNNFWVGIYVSNVYDEFETIELKNFEKNKKDTVNYEINYCNI